MGSGNQTRRARGAVRVQARRVIKESWESQANLSVFLALTVLVTFVLPVLGFGRDDLKLYADVAYSLMLISGVALAWGQTTLIVIAGLVGLLSVAVRWMNFFSPTTIDQVWADLSSIAAILVIGFILLLQVFRPGRVGHTRIQGAIAVYLIFGAAWAHAFHLIATLQPGSFNNALGPHSDVSEWIYYSYTTLSTLGYGDITAVRPPARLLSVGEALTGQLYLAVLIARLVAMDVVDWQESHHDSSADSLQPEGNTGA